MIILENLSKTCIFEKQSLSLQKFNLYSMNKNYWCSLISLLLVSIVLVSCNEGKIVSYDSLEPFFFNKTNTELVKTQDFIKNNRSPQGVITVIMVDPFVNPGDAAKSADEFFDVVATEFRQTENPNAFYRQGLLIYASQNNSLIQMRVGSEFENYLKMKGITAGAKYISLQKEAQEKGIDAVIPLMTQSAWQHINNLQDMNFIEKVQMKITISWIGDVLCYIGTPSDSLWGKIPSMITSIISKVAGHTHSMMFALAFILLIVWIINYYLDKLLDRVPKKDKPKMLVGHVNSFQFFVKLFANIILVTPALSTFTYFSNLRTEDLLFFEADNLPYLNLFDWSLASTVTMPSMWVTLLLSIVFFFSYILLPRRLFAYYIIQQNEIALLNKNHTLRDQCIDIVRKGKWDFRLFLGAIFCVVLGTLLFYLLITFKFIAGLILAALSFFLKPIIEGIQQIIESLFGTGVDISTGGLSTDINVAPGENLSNIHLEKVSDVKVGKNLSEIKTNIGHSSYDDNSDDNDNIGKSMAGMGIAEAIASKLPPKFFINPINCTFNRVLKEGIILSIVLLLFTPFLFNEGMAVFFIFLWGTKTIISFVFEFSFAYKLIREKNENVKHILLGKKLYGQIQGTEIISSYVQRLKQNGLKEEEKEQKKVVFDKIRKQGYGSLTREEKNLLFENDDNSTNTWIGYIDKNKPKDEKEKMSFQDYIMIGFCYIFFLIVLCSFVLLIYYCLIMILSFIVNITTLLVVICGVISLISSGVILYYLFFND